LRHIAIGTGVGDAALLPAPTTILTSEVTHVDTADTVNGPAGIPAHRQRRAANDFGL
jgi:hypothetical protein